jgi:hypothetical protein
VALTGVRGSADYGNWQECHLIGLFGMNPIVTVIGLTLGVDLPLLVAE